MAKLGSKKRPVVVNVHTDERAREIASICEERGLTFIMGFNRDEPEDISDLEKIINQPAPKIYDDKVGRNEPCPCGSGKKYKKCCGT